MSDTKADLGKVVVNRAVSVDGFIAGPDDEMGWIFEHLAGEPFPEVVAATGAILAGRRTQEVGERMAGEQAAYDGGPVFVLSHHPPAAPRPGVTYLSGGLTDAVATARAAAGGKDLEILGADLASQCLRAGLVDESFAASQPTVTDVTKRLVKDTTPGRGGQSFPNRNRRVETLGYRIGSLRDGGDDGTFSNGI